MIDEVAASMSTPPQPRSDTRSEIAALLHEQFARMTRQLRALELPQGLTPERLSALSVIEKRGRISVKALADQEMVRPATMSRMVTALAEQGFVRRSDDESDGRGVLISTTAKGRRAYQRAQEQRLRHFAGVLDSLGADQLSTMRDLIAVLHGLTLLLEKSA